MIDWDLFIASMPSLMHGALFSLLIAFCAAFLGTLGGSSLALMQMSSFPALRYSALGYVHLIRGTPMLVQIMFLFYASPQIGLWLSPIAAAILAIGMNSSAYLSQIIRIGIEGVDPLERQAARGLGMNRLQIITRIILPQTWRSILPALGNEATTLLKDSSLASVVGVMELTKVGAMIRSRTYDAFTSILAVAFIYLILTLILQKIVQIIEQKGKRPCSW
jgi:His/Glu/Gln/Arg/opine family amino acid ABC transporter permease subunit